MLLTIFTPVYNRAYTLKRLFESLVIQTSNNFEWLVVDDGSSDNIDATMNFFINQKKISIRYYKKENGGKHTAINLGVRKARGEIFFIVDSDDYLSINAVDRILYHYAQIRHIPNFAGVCGLKAFPDGRRIGGEVNWNILDCNSIDFRYVKKIKGDAAEVFRTDLLKRYPFPEIEGEKFLTEAIVWNRISKKYRLRNFNEKIYYAEYLPNGLSSNSKKLFLQNWKGSMLYYSELIKVRKISLAYKLIFLAQYWRIFFASDSSINNAVHSAGLFSILFLPFGLFLHILYDLSD